MGLMQATLLTGYIFNLAHHSCSHCNATQWSPAHILTIFKGSSLHPQPLSLIPAPTPISFSAKQHSEWLPADKRSGSHPDRILFHPRSL